MVNLAASEFNAPEVYLLPMTPPSQLDATFRDFTAAILSGIAAPVQSEDATETSNT